MRLDRTPRTSATPARPGDRYGHYVLVENYGAGDWLARCDCGAEKEVRLSQLKLGRVSRCSTCRDNRGPNASNHPPK